MRDPFATVPACPMCDGPCGVEFDRGDYRFPDRLPHADGRHLLAGKPHVPKSATRGRRPHTSPEDRMRRLYDHRAHQSEADD